jgi:hypothetical protein
MKKAAKATWKQVSKFRPNYYRLFIDGIEVSEFRYPSKNPYLAGLTLSESANIEAQRILNS